MPEQSRYCTENFTLARVMMRPPAFIYLAALIGFFVIGSFYTFVLSALLFSGVISLRTIYLLRGRKISSKFKKMSA